MNKVMHNQKYKNYNNNYFHNDLNSYYGFYNSESYLYPPFNAKYKEEKRLSLDDKLRIQKILKNLQNNLEKFYPVAFIFRLISWLHYQCITQKSDQPLKKFLIRNNVGFLWTV